VRGPNHADPHRFATFSGVNSGPADSNDPTAAKLHRGTLSDRNSAIGPGTSLTTVEESAVTRFPKKEDTQMLNWAVTFLVIALIAGILGMSGIAGAATQIAWILFVVFLVLFLVGLVMGRRPPV
jgi:uncharacterized membrane protein YtjA (UPF0391 family)